MNILNDFYSRKHENCEYEFKCIVPNEDEQIVSATVNMSLFESIKHFIRLCQLFGLVPISATKDGQTWKLNRLLECLLLIHIIFLMLIFSANLILSDSLNDFDGTVIQVILFYMFTVLCYMHALALLIEIYWKRKYQRRLLNIFTFLDRTFAKHLNVEINYRRLKRSENWMIFYSLIQSIVLLGYMLYSYYNQNLINTVHSMLLYWPGYFIGKLSYLYLTFSIKLIGTSIEVLNQYLKQTTKPSGYYFRETYKNSKTKQSNLNVSMLHVINRMYSSIWESSILVNHLMSWSLPFGIFYEFYLLIYYLYYILYYIFILRNVALSTYFRMLVWFLSVLLNMLLLTNTCRNTIEIVSIIFNFM